jgi:hypothetical protein
LLEDTAQRNEDAPGLDDRRLIERHLLSVDDDGDRLLGGAGDRSHGEDPRQEPAGNKHGEAMRVR